MRVGVSEQVGVICGSVGAVVTVVGLDVGTEGLPSPCGSPRPLRVTVQPHHLLVMSNLLMVIQPRLTFIITLSHITLLIS